MRNPFCSHKEHQADTQQYAFNTKDYLTTPPAQHVKFSPSHSVWLLFDFVNFPHSASCRVNLFFSCIICQSRWKVRPYFSVV